MIAFLGDNSRPLDGTPRHLMERRLTELLDSWMSVYGIRALDVTSDGVVSADISGVFEPQNVFGWLESIGAVAVSVEPQDLQTLAGRSPFSLAAGELLHADPAVKEAMARLTPGEVMDEVSKLLVLANNVGEARRESWAGVLDSERDPGLRAVFEDTQRSEDAIALERLKAAGFEIPPDSEDWLAYKPDPAPSDKFDDWGGVGVTDKIADPFAFEN